MKVEGGGSPNDAMLQLQKTLQKRAEMMQVLSNVMEGVQMGGVVDEATLVLSGLMGQAMGMTPDAANDMVTGLVEKNRENSQKLIRSIR